MLTFLTVDSVLNHTDGWNQEPEGKNFDFIFICFEVTAQTRWSVSILLRSIAFGAKMWWFLTSWCQERCDGILHEWFHSYIYIHRHVNILKVLARTIGFLLNFFRENACMSHPTFWGIFWQFFLGTALFCWWANFATGFCACACVLPLGCVTFALMMRWSWLNELVFAKCLLKYASSYYRKVLDIYI